MLRASCPQPLLKRMHIQDFVDRCEWSKLRKTLEIDSALAITLTENPVLGTVLNAKQCETILRGIKNLQKMHSKEISALSDSYTDKKTTEIPSVQGKAGTKGELPQAFGAHPAPAAEEQKIRFRTLHKQRFSSDDMAPLIGC